MVPADSGKVPRASPYSGAASGSAADFAYRAFTCYGLAFQPVLLSCGSPLLAVLQPRHNAGLGFSPFARHYSGNRCCFPLLRVLRCFSSPGCSTKGYEFAQSAAICYDGWVAPFGNLRIVAYLRLPGAYRR